MSIPENLKSDLLLCTVYLHRLLRNHARNEMGSGAELSILNNLEHWGGPDQALTQKELAEHEQISQAAISHLVKKLKNQDLIKSKKNPKDSRSTLVSLTAKGRRYLSSQGADIKSVFDEFLSELSDKELKQVAEAQAILSRTLKQSTEVQRKVSGRQADSF